MRLLTHNQLICLKPDCGQTKGFPLQIVATKVEKQPSELSTDFLLHILPTVDFKALHKAVSTDLGLAGFPEAPPAPEGKLNAEEHGAFLQALHDALLDLHIIEGSLVCPTCKRVYPIQASIPNMRLNETEITGAAS